MFLKQAKAKLKEWKQYQKVVSKDTPIYRICCGKIIEWQNRVKQT